MATTFNTKKPSLEEIAWAIITSTEAQRIKGVLHAFIVPLFMYGSHGLFGAVEYIFAAGILYNFAFGEDREEARNSFNLTAMVSIAAFCVVNAIAPVGGVQ